MVSSTCIAEAAFKQCSKPTDRLPADYKIGLQQCWARAPYKALYNALK